MLILSNEDAEALLTMSDCIAALDEAYREQANDEAVNAARSDAVTQGGRPDTVYSLKLMGAVVRGLGVSVVRLNSDIISFANQRQKKLPLAPGGRYTGLVLLFSTETGEPLAIFPDGVLQLMRVGATSAIAARYLAREDARTVAVLGAGAQAAGHVLAIAAMRKLDAIRCYSPTADKREAFCREMEERTGVAMRGVSSAQEAVRGADIVLCATNSVHHVFKGEWLAPGMHVCTIRGPELDPGVVKAADLIAVHDRGVPANAAATRGAVVPKDRHVIPGLDVARSPTLAHLVAGIAPGRTSASQRSCFVNLPGTGLQFAAAGAAFYRKALAAGRGRQMPTEWFTEDVVP
jgi:ornithine cyclodeaminase/alanine dehydrogenase-like protein (mu-crystallin family)